MSAVRSPREKRAPRFTAYIDAEVDIDPEDLEREGWVYVGKASDKTIVTDAFAIDVVRAWHDDEHDGPWRWCQHVLCDQLRGREPNT